MSGAPVTKVVVITGASSGNGRATAHEFARQGAKLVLAARRGPVLDEVAKECRAFGGEALAFPMDVSDALAVETLATAAVQTFGSIDVWINSAAVLHFGRIDETPSEDLERVITVNVLGYIHGSRSSLKQFRRQRHGVLINIGSVLGLTAQPFASAYVASKAAILGLSESLRQEVADEPHIQVCTVLPYSVDTPIYQRAANHLGREVRPVLPRYSAYAVAKTVLRLAQRPKPTVHVGLWARLASLLKFLPAPLRSLLIRRTIEGMQIVPKDRAATSGNLFKPIYDRWDVSGGWQNPRRSANDKPTGD